MIHPSPPCQQHSVAPHTLSRPPSQLPHCHVEAGHPSHRHPSTRIFLSSTHKIWKQPFPWASLLLDLHFTTLGWPSSVFLKPPVNFSCWRWLFISNPESNSFSKFEKNKKNYNHPAPPSHSRFKGQNYSVNLLKSSPVPLPKFWGQPANQSGRLPSGWDGRIPEVSISSPQC